MIHGRDRRGPYGRLFGFLPACEPSLKTIAALCAEIDPGAVGENPAIPAGYTYFAQFVDHDLTFDPTPPGRRVDDPANLRTPRLDLDSLYGAGPLDQPYLYDGARMILGGTCALPDLPRLRKRAIIGDPRNDEHLLIAQLHLLFMRFHNAVVERVEPRFEEAQRLVRWHYQWIVLHDFLDRVLGRALATAIRAERRFFHAPYIPLEFSGAAYRFAHAMVRGSYELTPAGKAAGQSFRILPARVDAPAGTHLGGFRPLTADLKVDWPFFFTDLLSHRIGLKLANPLKRLPAVLDRHRRGLDRLDLLRGQSLGLPGGRDVARAIGAPELPDAPLWFYVLAEAEALGDHGAHLGPVGGRIVGEVLVGLVEHDPNSYLRRWPKWRPTLAGDDDFTMADLVEFTQ